MSDAGRTVPDGADAPARPCAREDVVFRELSSEWVLYDPRSRQLHVLNLTAALVWSFCDGAHDVGRMVERVRETLEDAPPPPRVRHDVEDALATFAREGLLA